MRRLLAGWDALDPALGWLLRINLLALTASTVLLGAAYLLGFRHTAVVIDLAVMVVSLVLMLVTLPLCRATAHPPRIVGLDAVGAAVRRRRHLGDAQPQPADRAADAGAAAGGLPLRLARLAQRADGRTRWSAARRWPRSAEWRRVDAAQRAVVGQRRRHRVLAARRRSLVVIFLVRDAYQPARASSPTSSSSRAPASSRSPTPPGAASSATCTTAPSSGCWR